jgi:hypothetical protein
VVTLALAALTIGIVPAQIAIHAGSSKPVPTISDPGYAAAISALPPRSSARPSAEMDWLADRDRLAQLDLTG